jgi:uncharacterized membrane-anchored protein
VTRPKKWAPAGGAGRRSETLARMNDNAERAVSKVPEVTFVFWIIKIAATTLGECGYRAIVNVRIGAS